jgi:DNA-directed RNA polymerase subunit K/omega
MGDKKNGYHNFISTEQCMQCTGYDKYEVALLIAQRARELNSGVNPEIETGHHRPVNIALAEMVSGELDIDSLHERMVANFSRPRAIGTAYKKPVAPLVVVEETEKKYREPTGLKTFVESKDPRRKVSYSGEETDESFKDLF